MPANHCSVMERCQIFRGKSNRKEFEPLTETKITDDI